MHKLHVLLLALSTAAASMLVTPAASAAVQNAGEEQCHVRVTGTVTSVVSPSEFAIEAGRNGNVHVFDRDARIDPHGLTLRPGVYVAANGCWAPQRRSFRAESVTLATSQAAYSRYNRPQTAIQIGPCHESVFGTIRSMPRPNALMLSQLHTGRMLYVDYRGASIRSNGQSLRPGVFAGLYGCYERNETVFKAESATLASSVQTYRTLREEVTVRGVIDEVHPGMLGVRTLHNGHIHVYTAERGFRLGETVIATGPFDPLTGALRATSVRME
jgi:hypothetical protein